MCGRTRLTVSFEVLAKLYRLEPVQLDLGFEPRVEVRPTTPIPVVRLLDGKRRLGLLRWGIIPSWSKDRKLASKAINARSETLAKAPAFRAAFKSRRCLVVSDGFYEWHEKQAHLVHFSDDAPLTMAGLWETWTSPEGEIVETCTILTRESAGPVQKLSDRMPVILAGGQWDAWLEPATKPAALAEVIASSVTDVLTEPTRLLDRVRPPPAQGRLFE